MQFGAILRGALRGTRQLLQRTPASSKNENLTRCLCSSDGPSQDQVPESRDSLVQVKVDSITGVATVAMNRPPVNSLNLDLLTDLHIALEKLDKTSTGIILSSTIQKVFSAGLDLSEIYQPKSRERLSALWFNLQEVYVKLYGSSRPVIAAINGHAPAAGTILVAACDYRIMAEGNYSVGANETQLGLLAPFWMQDMLISIMGKRQASLMCQLGTTFSSQEALNVGLVDKIVPQTDVMKTAQEEMNRWIKVPDFARHLTKVRMNRDNLNYFLARRDEDVKWQVDFFLKDSVQKIIGDYLQALKDKKSK